MARPRCVLATIATIAGVVAAATSGLTLQDERRNAFVDALRPALPFPPADDSGELPAHGGAEPRWFVVWPEGGGTRVHVKANPLHPDTQAAGVEADTRIQRVVEEAERRAQAAYEKAVEEVKRTGKEVDVSGVTLGDEGVEGERIDADLELTIDLDAPAASYEAASRDAPLVSALPAIGAWIVRTPAYSYRDGEGRERFAAAEARIFFGLPAAPAVSGRHPDRFTVTLPSAAGTFAVRARGNARLLEDVVGRADWPALARARP